MIKKKYDFYFKEVVLRDSNVIEVEMQVDNRIYAGNLNFLKYRVIKL